MQTELTLDMIVDELGHSGNKVCYDAPTKTVRITNSNSSCISDTNLFLLDCYPHYLDNISYGENWLEVSGINISLYSQRGDFSGK